MFPRVLIAIALALIVTTDGLRIVGRQCSRLSSSQLNAGKDKAEGESKPGAKLPEGKDVIRRVLWATTPWIFNSFEVRNLHQRQL
jgi:hypothetical protein